MSEQLFRGRALYWLVFTLLQTKYPRERLTNKRMAELIKPDADKCGVIVTDGYIATMKSKDNSMAQAKADFFAKLLKIDSRKIAVYAQKTATKPEPLQRVAYNLPSQGKESELWAVCSYFISKNPGVNTPFRGRQLL